MSALPAGFKAGFKAALKDALPPGVSVIETPPIDPGEAVVLRDLYRRMLLLRRFEERVAQHYAEGHIPGFVHLYIGQEACAVGVAAALEKKDRFASYHRGHGHHLARGARPDRMFAELFARETGYCRGRGGCLHITDTTVGSLGANGIVGSGLIIANGSGLSAKLKGDEAVTVCFFGEGASNQGKFHEALNLAAVWRLPVVFFCENNGYGESSPQPMTTSVEHIAVRALGYGMPGLVVDGNDVLAVREAARQAVDRARAGEGPTLIEAKTQRWRGHFEGDPETYRTREEVAAYEKDCPLSRLAGRLAEAGLWGPADEEALEAEVREELDRAVAFALESPEPDPADLMRDIWTSPGAGEGKAAGGAVSSAAGAAPVGEMRLATGLEAVQEALCEEMRRDPDVVMMGQDMHQGVYGVSTLVYEEFGPERVRPTPISENAMVGCAVGAAMTGLRPVVEIMFADFLMECMDPLINQAAKLRYMTGGQVSLPLVVRVPGGSGFAAGAQHSQSPESMFTQVPGLKVVCASTPADIRGLLKTAIRDDNPVLFIEHKALYYEGGEMPAESEPIPFGVADIKRPGTDVTVVAILAMVPRVLRVAETLEAEGVSIEVVDPRTLVPLDKETILGSVRRTGRLVIVEEGNLTGGVGAEIAAIAAAEAIDYLDAPVIRVAAPDTPIPFSPVLEEFIAPSEERIADAIRDILHWGNG
jgi:pyruvate/2-oxoglutarate/acetoin dehydrogenase E1 component/TPP-dependent pyruvate/acetoin dehydrogenase alpha subunit